MSGAGCQAAVRTLRVRRRGVPGHGPGLGDRQGRGNHAVPGRSALPGLPRMGPLKGAAGSEGQPDLSRPSLGSAERFGPKLILCLTLCAWGRTDRPVGTRPLAAGFTCPSLPFGPVKWKQGLAEAILADGLKKVQLQHAVEPCDPRLAGRPSFLPSAGRAHTNHPPPRPGGGARGARHRSRKPAAAGQLHLLASPPPQPRPTASCPQTHSWPIQNKSI